MLLSFLRFWRIPIPTRHRTVPPCFRVHALLLFDLAERWRPKSPSCEEWQMVLRIVVSWWHVLDHRHEKWVEKACRKDAETSRDSFSFGSKSVALRKHDCAETLGRRENRGRIWKGWSTKMPLSLSPEFPSVVSGLVENTSCCCASRPNEMNTNNCLWMKKSNDSRIEKK